MSEASKEEIEFQEKINKIVSANEYGSEVGMHKAENELNDFLKTINKMNIGRDLVAHVHLDKDNSVKIDIFCRNERMDQIQMKIETLMLDAEKNKDLIKETKLYIEEINRIGKFQ